MFGPRCGTDDPDDDDDPLCLAEIRLDQPSGRINRLALPSIIGEAPSLMSFSYEIVSGEVLPRADQAAVIFRNLRVFDVPVADVDSSSDPYLKFWLLECPARKRKPQVRTKDLTDAANPAWEGPIQLVFPDDSPAAASGEPLVRIMLYAPWGIEPQP